MLGLHYFEMKNIQIKNILCLDIETLLDGWFERIAMVSKFPFLQIKRDSVVSKEQTKDFLVAIQTTDLLPVLTPKM